MAAGKGNLLGRAGRRLASERARLLAQLRDLRLPGGETHRYGSDSAQCADLYLPSSAGPHPVIVLIHGGAWQSRHRRTIMRALAADVLGDGWAAWNIEFRRIGNGGGWPATFLDVAAAIDHLDRLEAPLDLGRVAVLGHSSGGQLALWAAARTTLPAGAPGAIEGMPRIPVSRAISLAGVCDLAGAHAINPHSAVMTLIGGSPAELPERFALADPIARIPLPVPVLLVHGVNDQAVPVELARGYAQRARAAGADVELAELDGGDGIHRAALEPGSAAWALAARWLGALTAGGAQPLAPGSGSARTLAPVAGGAQPRAPDADALAAARGPERSDQAAPEA